ncbi:MAG: ATP-binding protein [Victivallales bacterium]|nr:ATP-binding protein [Victivallales bacterium]
MKIIKRTAYIDKLQRLKDSREIKVITGVRRAGKSQLLLDIAMRARQEKANVIHLDLSDLENEPLLEYHSLNDYVLNHTVEYARNVLLIDEVQECKGFEKAINSLYNKNKYDIYLSGSNAFLLSSDLATLFTGRQIEIPVFPFSFSEYAVYYDEEKDMEALFDRYVIEGGLAGSYIYSEQQDRIAYIKELFHTILNRDLVQKYRLTEPAVLRHLAEYLMDNVGNLTSPNKSATHLVQNKISTNHVTAANYLEYMTQAFLFYPVKRYDIRGKRYLSTIEKFFLCDLGFRYAILGQRNMDYGHAYENLVLLELLRRGYEVYVGKLYDLEVDFIAMHGSEKIYIQVSDDISSAETFQRELAPLGKIHDAYPKLLIARTRHLETDHEGIRIINLVDWLLRNG